MLILPISRSWILSRAAERIYLGCAILSLGLSGTWIGTSIAQPVVGNLPLTVGVSAILRVIFFAETIGAALLWTAMLYFWFGFDRSSWLKRALWFVALGFVVPFFWALYFFVVYRRQVAATRHISIPAGMSVARMLM